MTILPGSFSPTRQLPGLILPVSKGKAGLRLVALIGVLIALGLTMAWLPLTEVVLLVGGAIFLTLLLLKPVLSLYILIPLIPFSPWFSIPIGGAKVGLMEIVLALGVVTWLLQLSIGKQKLTDLFSPSPPLLAPFLLFLAAVSLSWLGTLSLGASLVETIKWIEMVGLYLLVIALLPATQIKWAVAVILLTGIAQAALGLYQFIFKIGPDGFLLFGGQFLRAYGTFAQPNPYGGYLGLILPLAFSLTLWGVASISKPDRSGITNILFLILVCLPLVTLLAALFASQSRGAWLGFSLATVVTLALYNKKSLALLVTAILIGSILTLVGAFDIGTTQFSASYDSIVRRLVDAGAIFTITEISAIEVNDANFATIERLAHWQAARQMWRDHLWLGVGFGNYPVVYPAYAVGRWLNPLGHAHNYLLNIGAETGLIGITTYLIFWIFTFGVLWRAAQQSRGFYRAVAIGGFGIMVHLHVHNLFDNLYVQGLYLHIAIVLAMVSVIYRSNRSREPQIFGVLQERFVNRPTDSL